MKTGASSKTMAQVLLASAVAAQNSTSICCHALEKAGLENVYYPGSELYQDRVDSYFSVSSQLEPYCFVQPTSTEDVSQIIKTLVPIESCQWAIRGGGHTIWPGANNIIQGVTIDMREFTGTKFVPETKVAQISPGTLWQDVYGALEPYGVTAAGGRTGTVGVAGFLTGGGNSYYTAERGLGCDQVVNWEVVLATGEVINANSNENADLGKALKGGSANLGIVTRFDVQAFDAPHLWGGLVVYNKNQTDKHIQAYNYVHGSIIPFWTYDPSVEDVVINVSYEDTTGAEKAPAFDEYMAIPYETSSLRVESHRNMSIELDLVAGYRNVWYSITFKNDKDLYRKALSLHREFVTNWKAQSPDGDFICHAIFQSIPTIFSDHSVAKGGNVLGLDRETENAVMFQVQLMVNGEEQENLGRQRMVEFRNAIKAYSVEKGAAVQWEYLNYADYTQDPLSTYGKENDRLIREVASKYDPEGVFQTRMPGGFKISNVME